MQFDYLESWTSVFKTLMFWVRDEAEGWVKQGRGGMVCVCVCGGGLCQGHQPGQTVRSRLEQRENTCWHAVVRCCHRGVFWCPDVSVNGFDSAVSQRHCCCCCCCKVPERWNSINIFIQGWAAACFSLWWTSFSLKAVALQGVWSYLSTEWYEALQWNSRAAVKQQSCSG